MKSKLTFRYASFATIRHTLIILSLIFLFSVVYYKTDALNFDFIIFWLFFMSIFLVPMIIITVAMQRSITFDFSRKSVVAKRWFCKYEIPLGNLKISKRKEVHSGPGSWPAMILYLILGDRAKTFWRLLASDRHKEFIIAESIFEAKIKKLESALNKHVHAK